MGTNKEGNQIRSRFENLSLAFTDYDGPDEWNERKVNKPPEGKPSLERSGPCYEIDGRRVKLRIITLSREFNDKFRADPDFLKLASFEQNFRRLDWISAQMEGLSKN